MAPLRYCHLKGKVEEFDGRLPEDLPGFLVRAGFEHLEAYVDHLNLREELPLTEVIGNLCDHLVDHGGFNGQEMLRQLKSGPQG